MATEITQTGYSTKTHLQIDQSIFALYGMHATNYFASLGIFIFMRQGPGFRGNKITVLKSMLDHGRND